MNSIYFMKTPFNDIVLKIEDDGEYIRSIGLQEHACGGCLNAMPSPLGYRLKKQLKEYFEGSRREFDIPIDPDAESKAGDIIAIPYGEYDDSVTMDDDPILILIPSHRCNTDCGNDTLRTLLGSLRKHEKENSEAAE